MMIKNKMENETKILNQIKDCCLCEEDQKKIISFIECSKSHSMYGKCLIFYGQGDNGKSTLLELMKQYVPDHHSISQIYDCIQRSIDNWSCISDTFVSLPELKESQKDIDTYFLEHIIKRKKIKMDGNSGKILPTMNVLMVTNNVMHNDDLFDTICFRKRFP